MNKAPSRRIKDVYRYIHECIGIYEKRKYEKTQEVNFYSTSFTSFRLCVFARLSFPVLGTSFTLFPLGTLANQYRAIAAKMLKSRRRRHAIAHWSRYSRQPRIGPWLLTCSICSCWYRSGSGELRQRRTCIRPGTIGRFRLTLGVRESGLRLKSIAPMFLLDQLIARHSQGMWMETLGTWKSRSRGVRLEWPRHFF